MKTAIVMGAGFGGMASALRLRAKGYKVTLIEKSDSLGGRAQVFKRDGFIYDAGPTVITAPFLIKELFDLFGKNVRDYVKIFPVEPWYRFYFQDGTYFNYGGTIEDTLNEISKISPEDCSGYKKLLKSSESIFKIGFEELAHKPFNTLWSMIVQIPSLLKLKAYQSVYSFVSSHLKHDKLRQAFSIQPLLVGGNPFDTTSIYNLIHFLERKWGIHYAVGGMTSVVAALERLMVESGIDIIKGNEIKKIETQNKIIKTVITDSGEQYCGDIFISNMDPVFLYKNLLNNELSLTSKIKANKSELSMGLFVLYFGTKSKFEDVAHHTIWLGKRYKELLSDIFDKKTLADDFSLYVHRPTASDPNLAPKNCDCFYVLSPVPNLSANIDWEVTRDIYSEKIISALDNSIMPGLKDSIVHSFNMTPEEFKTNYCSEMGAGFSISPKLTQSAWFRFHNKSESIKNLYLVGAGTHPGAGLPGVLSSAKVIDELIPNL